MRLFTLLSGYVLLMLGVMLSIHFDFWLGLAIMGTFAIKFAFMLPDHKERL